MLMTSSHRSTSSTTSSSSPNSVSCSSSQTKGHDLSSSILPNSMTINETASSSSLITPHNHQSLKKHLHISHQMSLGSPVTSSSLIMKGSPTTTVQTSPSSSLSKKSNPTSWSNSFSIDAIIGGNSSSTDKKNRDVIDIKPFSFANNGINHLHFGHHI